MKNLYDILGVPENADADTIKKAYRALAKKYHPDATGGDKRKTERFKEIGDAYGVLSDEKRRREYDRLRQAPVGADGMPQGFDADMFSQIFGDFRAGTNQGGGAFGDLFSTLFGGGMGGNPRVRHGGARGADTQASITVDFREAALGTRRTLRSPKGTSVEVTVPPGVETGTRLRVPGQGEPGPRGGIAGDLYLDVRVTPDPHLVRNDLDVELRLPLTLGEALLGTTLDVPTVEGTVRLKVPAGTSSGAKMRLRGKGIKSVDGRRGDQFCRVEIVLPKIAEGDDETRRLAEELDRRTRGGKVREF